MSKMGSSPWHKAVDRETRRTAKEISAALDKMVGRLPKGAAPQMSIELVVRELAGKQPWFMQLIMEDTDIREAYWAATAEQPLAVRSVND